MNPSNGNIAGGLLRIQLGGTELDPDDVRLSKEYSRELRMILFDPLCARAKNRSSYRMWFSESAILLMAMAVESLTVQVCRRQYCSKGSGRSHFPETDGTTNKRNGTENHAK